MARILLVVLVLALLTLAGCHSPATTEFDPSTAKATLDQSAQPETSNDDEVIVIRIGQASVNKESGNAKPVGDKSGADSGSPR